MGVIAKLIQCLKLNSEDEQGFVNIASERSDMQKCRAFTNPGAALNGLSWQERLANACQILQIRLTVSQVLSSRPLRYDQLASAWDAKLCPNHSLFAKDRAQISEALALGADLLRLQRGLAAKDKDCALISSAWHDEFRDLVRPEELDTVREAMRRHFTGPNCIERVSLSLANDSLTVEWNWREATDFCFVGVRDAKYPDACAGTHPNGFRFEATGGKLITPFSGRSAHVRIWAMFRFLDEFILGDDPLERKLAIVEYSVTKPLLRSHHRLTLTSLSGGVAIPALAVIISENSLMPGSEEALQIPAMILEATRTLEIVLPPTLAKDEDLYLSLRPLDRNHEKSIQLRPRSRGAIVIRL